MFNILRFLDIFHRGGSNQNKYFNHSSKQISFFDLLSFLAYTHLSSFRFLVLICTMGNEIGRFSKIIDQKYPLQHSRNLFYQLQLLIHNLHLQLLMHNLQVIRHKYPYLLDLIINKLPPIKTRTFFKYRWHPLIFNTTKTKLQCSGHI